ncbi:hypothetical protein Patl1_10763 [Pistacia atlantica]|uniref:Uncharacterized protein n=1 Tax=Pistacia atlantica TaxID=434234 RepID=A0ACC1A2M6_9ROSI|nr:hypothetical protein Patl1_10763 [Pistacia atlantica]
MGVMSRRVVPVCANLCFFCPSPHARTLNQMIEKMVSFVNWLEKPITNSLAFCAIL